MSDLPDATALAGRFPPDFLWGAATAAYQIEGGHDADGKGPSIWDTFCRVPGAIATGETGDIACDHYRRWREDVELMRALGLNAYRFSVSWPRVIPAGTGRVNERGLDFYRGLVDALLERGIRPFLTLYHWDLPEALQRRGGWANAESPSWFAEYARAVAAALGDRVSDWMTLNEPEVVSFAGHGVGVHAPGIKDWRIALRVSRNLLLAHREGAGAVRAERADARVGIACNLSPCEPATDAAEDVAAARRRDGAANRWFLDPLFGRGFPRDMLAHYGDLHGGDALDGYDGALDFLGVNYYTRQVCRASNDGVLKLAALLPPGVSYTNMPWEIHPRGLTEILERVHRDYRPKALLVTENGAAFEDHSDSEGRVADPDRLAFLARHIAAAADAVGRGVPLLGYFVWTLIDNFEWAHGTSKRFGLVHVDYATQRRRVKRSGEWYRALIAAARADVPAEVAT